MSHKGWITPERFAANQTRSMVPYNRSVSELFSEQVFLGQKIAQPGEQGETTAQEIDQEV
jgi:hypothetical protein